MNGARIRVCLLALTDALCLGAIFLGTMLLYRKFGDGDYYFSTYLNLSPMILIFLICNGFIRLYHGNFFYPGANLAPQEELRRLIFSVSLTYLLLFAYLMLTRENFEYSRFVLLVSWALTCLLVMPCRNVARILMKRFGIGKIRVLIAGAGETGRALADLLAYDEHFGFETAGFLDDDPNKKTAADGQVPIAGTLDRAGEIADRLKVDYLICCLPLPVIQRHLKPYLARFQHLAIIPANQVVPGAWTYPTDFGGCYGIEIRNQLLLPGPRIMKAVFEIVSAFFGIVLLTPLLLALALLVKTTSRGPVLYGAKRLGQGGREIIVYKFRTMRSDAEEYLRRMLAEDPALAAEWKKNFKLEHDPRITVFGRFLRKTSLDELPQLFNVLKGDMAMVGPRPIVRDEVAYYGADYDVFCQVKPGITGLWQISGRSNTTYAQRVKFDLSYVMNWSVWLDLYILMRTVLEVLRGRGAK